jgi:3-methylcrotonyl-CoA carboxylase alpha subunit
MEMNTRLQVEHPVTEFITGIDLVEWQLRIARGSRLPKAQSEIVRHGAAVEARLYAEDPEHGYLPSVGRIAHLRWPDAASGLRLDSGVDAGDEVSTFYDPMLGKVIAWGESRSEAVDRLGRALNELEVVGVITNRALLSSVLADQEFQRGGIATNFLDVRRSQLSFGEPAADEVDAALAALWYATRRTEGDALWADTRGWRLGVEASSTWSFGERTVMISSPAPNGSPGRNGSSEHNGNPGHNNRPGGGGDPARDVYLAHAAGHEHALRIVARAAQSMDVQVDGQVQHVRIVEVDQDLHLFRNGRQAVLRLTRTEDALRVTAGAEEGSLLTPLPGTVVAVHVAAGQEVERGAPLVTVEAMKMEHTLTAPHAGMVTRVPFGVGERVAAGAVLAELSPRGG